MRVVKVTAPGNFTAFCEALNEPFYFLNGTFYLIQWKDAAAARAFCVNHCISRSTLAKMEFSEVELANVTGFPTEQQPLEADAELDDLSAEEREALAAYNQEIAEFGSVGMSRKAFIEDYISNNY